MSRKSRKVLSPHLRKQMMHRYDKGEISKRLSFDYDISQSTFSITKQKWELFKQLRRLFQTHAREP